MPDSKSGRPLPSGYARLPGSERRASSTAKFVEPADWKETLQVTIVLKRRSDAAIPSFDHFAKMAPGKRPRLSMEEFATRYGAHPDDLDRVVRFAERSQLRVVEVHAARRTVKVVGTVEQMNKAFAVTLGRYEHTITRYQGRTPQPHLETYRGREGFIHVPADLAGIVVGVFGLDNRTITRRNAADPPNTTTISVQQVAELYNFPTNSAAGQTIGIVSPTSGYGGYYLSDLQRYFGAALPILTSVSVDSVNNGSIEAVTTAAAAVGDSVMQFASTAGILTGSYVFGPNLTYYGYVTAVTATSVTLSRALTSAMPIGTHVFFNPDGETTQDICIAAAAAPGANVAVFFSNGDQAGWVDLIHRAILPDPTDPVCSVLSSSFYIANGDDTATLTSDGASVALVNAVSAAFQDAAIQGVTICIASGDTGSNSKAGKYPTSFSPLTYGGDGKAHVQYPGSDPWVLAVGGTTVGNIIANPPSFDEYVWNDPSASDPTQWGTTGGGVSDFFARPSYQDNAGVPKSVNDGTHVGRGVPDVAGNASYNSGYSGLFLAGAAIIGNGTSASAPHWAGLIAVLNAALGERLGFINPSIYQFGSTAFRDIVPGAGPADNSNSGITGYPAGPGWDACTGWGSPNGVALLTAFQSLPSVYISGGYQSPDVILTSLVTNQPIPLGGMPGGAWDTLLQPNTDYGFSAVVHNDGAVDATGVKVAFWAIPGGVGTSGAMVGVPQVVTVPAYGSVTVNASAHFTSAPLGGHMCAVVSVASAGTGCGVDPTTTLQIPDPGAPGTHACSAWRNTDSSTAGSNTRFAFTLGIGKDAARLAESIELAVHPVYVSAGWTMRAKARELQGVLSLIGAQPRIPLYLLPEFYRTFPPLKTKTRIVAKTGAEVVAGEAGNWRLMPTGKDDNVSFEITGQIPPTAHVGDVVLVRVTATYPNTEKRIAKSIEFLEVIHVVSKRGR